MVDLGSSFSCQSSDISTEIMPAITSNTDVSSNDSKQVSSDSPASASIWSEHKTPEGRTYYYNKETKKSSWALPSELQSQKAKPRQIEDTSLPAGWLAYKTPEGKIYYFNAELNKSSWTHPLTKNTVPQLRASEIAEMEPEDQFFYLLRKHGIASDYTWENTLRLIINDPIYSSAFKTVAERKEAFAKYLVLQKERERQLAERAEQEKKNAFKAIIEKIPQIHLIHRYRTIVPLICKEAAFLAISFDRERESVFEEVLHKVKQEKRSSELELQKKVKEKMRSMLAIIENWNFFSSSWEIACGQLEEMKEWATEIPDFNSLSRLDLLTAYESIVLEDEENHYKQAKKRHEEERTNMIRRRLSFSLHLETLVHKGLLTTSSQWIENIYPLIKDTNVFKELLDENMTGSCPLDLFYDTIDRLEAESVSFNLAISNYLEEYPHDILSNPKALSEIYSEAEEIHRRSEVFSGLHPINPRNRVIKQFVQSLFRHLENLFFNCREFQKDHPNLQSSAFSLYPLPLTPFRNASAILEKNYRTGLRRLVYFSCAEALLRQKKDEKKRSHAVKRQLYDEFKSWLKSNRSFVLTHESWSEFRTKTWNNLDKEFGALGEHLAARAFERFKEKSFYEENTTLSTKIQKLDNEEEIPFSSRPRVFKTFSRATEERPSCGVRPRTISSYSDIA